MRKTPRMSRTRTRPTPRLGLTYANRSSDLEREAKQKDEDAKKAHETLQRLSGWRTLTTKAEPINARIDELQRKLGEEHVVSDTSPNSETLRTIEALFFAAVIELGNRFGPEAIFKFIFFAAGVPLLLSSAPGADIEPDMQGNVVSPSKIRLRRHQSGQRGSGRQRTGRTCPLRSSGFPRRKMLAP